MTAYVITYRQRGRENGVHRVEAGSDKEAKNRFLNLDWVAFCEIEIVSIEPAIEPLREYDPYRSRARPASMRVATPSPAATQAPGSDWRAECDRLTDEIAKLADTAQTLARVGDHDGAANVRAQAKKLAAERAAITKRSKGR